MPEVTDLRAFLEGPCGGGLRGSVAADDAARGLSGDLELSARIGDEYGAQTDIKDLDDAKGTPTSGR